MDEPTTPPPTPDHIAQELPTLELELRNLKAKVAKIEDRLTWIERGVQAWARGQDYHSSPEASDDVRK